MNFFSVDVSFISLHHIFPVAQRITTPDAMGVCLVKPQFEAGREKVGKNGVVRDPAVHREVLHNAMSYAAENGFVVRGLDYSPVKGPEGNIEYLMFVQKSDQPLCWTMKPPHRWWQQVTRAGSLRLNCQQRRNRYDDLHFAQSGARPLPAKSRCVRRRSC